MKYSLITLWTSSLFLVMNAVPLPKSSEIGPAEKDDRNDDGLIGEKEDTELLSNEDSEESIADEPLSAKDSEHNVDDTLDINEDNALAEDDSNENIEEDRKNGSNGDLEIENTSKEEDIVESTANDETAVNIDEPSVNEGVDNGSQDSKEESTLIEDENYKASQGTEKRGTNLDVTDITDDDLVEGKKLVDNNDDNRNIDDDDDKSKSNIKIESEGKLSSDDKFTSDDDQSKADLISEEDNDDDLKSVEDKETYLSEEDGDVDDDGEYVTEIVEFTEIVGGDIVEENSGEVRYIKEGNIAYDHVGGDNYESGKKEIANEESSADIDSDKESKLVGTEVIIEETKLEDKDRKKSKSGHHDTSNHSNGNINKHKNKMNSQSKHSAATSNNEDSSRHKSKINDKPGHHGKSEWNDKINTKSKHHSSSTDSNEGSSRNEYKIKTNSRHHISSNRNGDSRDSKEEKDAKLGHHSTSIKGNEDHTEIDHDDHGSYEENISNVGKNRNKKDKTNKDKYKTMKDSYQYSITKDFEFEGSSEPKALRQSLLIKTGGFPYKNLPNYIKQDLLNRMPPQTDLQQVNNPFGIRARPSIDSINNALKQILTIKSGSIPQPGAWCCPNSMALKGFTCHSGDNKVPAEYFSHLTYFKFKDLLCQTGRPPAEVLGFMSGPMHEMMPTSELMNGDISTHIQGVVPGSQTAAIPGSGQSVTLGDSPFTSLIKQGGNHRQINQGLAMDVQAWPVKDNSKSGILETGQIYGSTGILPGSESSLTGAKIISSSEDFSFGAEDSVNNNFSPDLEIKKEIFENELIPWPGDSENTFGKIVDSQTVNNFPKNFESSSINQPLNMNTEDVLSSNWQLTGTDFADRFSPKVDKKNSIQQQKNEIEDELLNWGFPKSNSNFVGRLPPKYGKETFPVHQQPNPVKEEFLSWGFPMSGNQISTGLPIKNGKKEFLINHQSNPIPEKWGFPTNNNYFADKMHSIDGNKESLIHHQANPNNEEPLSCCFPENDSYLSGRISPNNSKDELVKDSFDSEKLLDNVNNDWINEDLEPKSYAWVPNDYSLVYDNLNQNQFDYTLQDKVLLKAQEELHSAMLSDPVTSNDYLLQDPYKNLLTKKKDF